MKKFLTFLILMGGTFLLISRSAIAQDSGCPTTMLLDYKPGLTRGGSILSSERNDPLKALGEPEDNDTFNFVSLGFGGEITLGFDKAIANGPGMDIRVTETSFNNETCESWPEKIEVFVSQDGVEWISVGIGCLDSEFDIPDDLLWIKYIKYKDVTDLNLFNNIDDGFDVDGTVCLNGPYLGMASVLPTLSCIRPLENDQYQAFFGYNNQNQAEITIPVGEDNFFAPVVNSGQPTQFLAGEQTEAFQVIFDGTEITWTLEGPDGTRNSVTANAQSPVCDASLTQAVLRGEPKICNPGESALIYIDLTGTGPFDLTYQDPAGNVIALNNIEGPIYELQVSQTGTYKLIAVSDANGPGITSGEASVALVEKPTLTIAEGTQFCLGVPVNGILTGSGPWTVVYLDQNNEQQTVENINQAEFTLIFDQPGFYQVIGIYDQYCENIFDDPLTLEVLEIPNSTINGGGFLCSVDDAAQIEIKNQGVAPFTVTYINPAAEKIELSELSNDFTFSSSLPGDYTLFSVSDARCKGTTSGKASITTAEKPTISLTQEAEICVGSELNFDLTGTGPWAVTYLDPSGQQKSVENIAISPLKLILETPGKYEILSISDQVCSHALAESLKIQVQEKPSAVLSGGGAICSVGNQVEIMVELTGTAPWTITYQDEEGNQGVVDNIQATPYVFNYGKATTLELVTVSDASCSGFVSGSAEIFMSPMPTMSLDKSTFCEGEEVEVKLNGVGPWSITYQIAGGDPNAISTDEATTILNLSQPGDYQLIGISDQNCSQTLSNPVNFSVKSLPTAVLGGETSFCAGETGNLKLDLTGIGPWQVTYADQDGNEFSVGGIDNQSSSISVDKAGVYSLVSVTDAFCAGTVSGQGSASNPVQPTAVISGGGDFCEGSEKAEIKITLTGKAPFDFTYTNGEDDVQVTGYNDDEYIFEAEASGDYELISLSDQNCTGNFSGAASVKYESIPDISLNLDQNVFCALSEPISLGGGSPAGGSFSGIGVSEGKFNPQEAGVGEHEITYTFTSESGCTAETKAQVTVTPQPSASLSGGGSFCSSGGEEVELTVDFSGSAPYSFTYTDGSENWQVSEIQEASHTFKVAKAGEYKLLSMNDAACNGSVAGEVTITDLANQLNAGPIAAETVCVEEPVTLEGNLAGEIESISWTSSGSGSFENSSNANTTYQPAENETGVVTFTLTIGNSCAEKTFETNTTIAAKPDADFTFQPDSDIYTGQEVLFTPTNMEGDSYNWDFGNGITSESELTQQVYEQQGTYIVTLAVTKDGCTASAENTLDVKLTRDLYIPNVFYPGAVSAENQVVKVYGEGISGQNFSFRIYNRWGIIIYETTDLSRAQNNGWDGEAKGNGEMLSTNVFTYLCKGQFEDGETFELTGTITLIK